MQGLSMTHIHKDVPINTDEVISHFALKNKRRSYADGTQANSVAAVYQCITAYYGVAVSDFNSDLSLSYCTDVFQIVTF